MEEQEQETTSPEVRGRRKQQREIEDQSYKEEVAQHCGAAKSNDSNDLIAFQFGLLTEFLEMNREHTRSARKENLTQCHPTHTH
jgi:hypothetical protein